VRALRQRPGRQRAFACAAHPDACGAVRRDARRRALGVLGALAAAGAALALSACSPGAAKFNAVDITGAEYAKAFSLPDHEGRVRTLADFQGKVVLLFFGFTHCPDVCPTALARMAELLKQLGPDAAKVQVLFLTVDPERDTQEILRQYVPSFHPSFLGLRADPAATPEVAKQFKVFYQKSPGTTAESYSVDHSAFTYVYDPQGRIRLLAKHDIPVDKLAADVATLLKGA
jgi:protein SCO1/2